MHPLETDISFSGPATYRIVIKGRIPDSYYGRFGSMQIQVIQSKDQFETVLIGIIADQSQLAGILSIFFHLRMPIKNIALLDKKESQQ